MTLRLTLGIDPGQSGAIAFIADGRFSEFVDFPTEDRAAGGVMIQADRLADRIRDVLVKHPGAYVYGVIEQVSARPGQGTSGMFRFGQAEGIARGVLGALKIRIIQVHPQTWKRYLQLTGKEKDDARLMAIRIYPSAAEELKRKKDCGRADALLIGTWAERTEQVARREVAA